jgi:hypothetical protein
MGRMDLEAWDPHTGKIVPAEFSHEAEAGCDVTKVRLTLPPTKSVFILGKGIKPIAASQSQRSH